MGGTGRFLLMEVAVRLKGKIALLLGVLLALLIVGVALAAPVVVDGNPAEWSPASKVNTDSYTTGLVTSTTDIKDVYFTNSPTHFFWRFDTILDTQWTDVNYAAICMDSRPAANVLHGPCLSDYTVIIDPLTGKGELWENSAHHVESVTVLVTSTLNVTEVGVPLAAVGITPANCTPGCDITAQIVLNGDFYTGTVFTSSDYNFEVVGDSPALTVRVGLDSPTALRLTNFTAGGAASTTWVLALAGLLALGAAVLYGRRRA